MSDPSEELPSPYHRVVKGVVLDAYDVLEAWGKKNSAVDHALKKLLAYGQRSGGKSNIKDLEECIWSLKRAIELEAPNEIEKQKMNAEMRKAEMDVQILRRVLTHPKYKWLTYCYCGKTEPRTTLGFDYSENTTCKNCGRHVYDNQTSNY